MKNPVLLIMAAGLGSRYGSLKQIDALGPGGESIIDYSLYDARMAGFRDIIFVIRKEHRQDFEDRFGYIKAQGMAVDFAYQSLDDLPAGFLCPAGRQRPWGTGHAVYAARNIIKAPFGIIAADDFYGRDTFVKLFGFLKNQCSAGHWGMVGYKLKNTLSENGSVSRGVCDMANGRLASVTERKQVIKDGDSVFYIEDSVRHPLNPEAVASMLVWGLAPAAFGHIEGDFAAFLASDGIDPLESEYYLPAFIDRQIKTGVADMVVLETESQWYGVTYKEDREKVRQALAAMHEQGTYPRIK